MRRRSSLVAVIALLLLSLAGGSVVSAHGGSDSSGSGSSGHHGGSQKQVELRVRASKATQGNSLKIRVKARHARHGIVLTGQAVVHFASGDVTVDLLPKSHGKQLRVRVPVAADEPLGPITIDVTVTIDGVAQPLVTLTTIVREPSLDD